MNSTGRRGESVNKLDGSRYPAEGLERGMRTMIVENDEGWYPSPATISRLRKLAKQRGLISDWRIVLALGNRDILLSCSHITGECGMDLVARKSKCGWEIVTEREYIEEK